MADSKRWTVTTSGDRPLSQLTKDMAKIGFAVDQILGEIGIVTGAGGDEVAKRLRQIPGVTDVSQEASIDIGPPDAPVNW